MSKRHHLNTLNTVGLRLDIVAPIYWPKLLIVSLITTQMHYKRTPAGPRSGSGRRAARQRKAAPVGEGAWPSAPTAPVRHGWQRSSRGLQSGAGTTRSAANAKRIGAPAPIRAVPPQIRVRPPHPRNAGECRSGQCGPLFPLGRCAEYAVDQPELTGPAHRLGPAAHLQLGEQAPEVVAHAMGRQPFRPST